MPTAEIITIGTEILLGEIVDTNATYIARCLRDSGIDLFRKVTVGDNEKRIAQAIQQSLERCDIVITTGGLGPTVDDPTRNAVALAIGVKNEYHPELWDQIEARFQRFGRKPTENNRRQAFIPEGAMAVENPVGTAPIFILEYQSHVITSLPGVPREMEYLMVNTVIPYLRKRYQLEGIIKTRVLHTVGVGESQVDELIGDLELLTNPTVGLLAHSGQVDVRITVKADSMDSAMKLIDPLEEKLRERLGDCIYGIDQESLEEVAIRSIAAYHWSIAIVESGLGGNLIRKFVKYQDVLISGQVIKETPSPDELLLVTDVYRQAQKADVGLGVAIHPINDRHDVYIAVITPHKKRQFTRPFGGPPEYAPIWALNQSLDIIRRIKNDD